MTSHINQTHFFAGDIPRAFASLFSPSGVPSDVVLGEGHLQYGNLIAASLPELVAFRRNHIQTILSVTPEEERYKKLVLAWFAGSAALETKLQVRNGRYPTFFVPTLFTKEELNSVDTALKGNLALYLVNTYPFLQGKDANVLDIQGIGSSCMTLRFGPQTHQIKEDGTLRRVLWA